MSHADGCQSGRMGRTANPLHPTRGAEGSNPSPSAWAATDYCAPYGETGEGLVFVPARGDAATQKRRGRLERALMLRDGAGCFYCGSPEPNTIDHVRPRRYGGSNNFENLVLACNPCNFEKSTAPAWFFVFRFMAPQIPVRLRQGLVRFARSGFAEVPQQRGILSEPSISESGSTGGIHPSSRTDNRRRH